MFSSSMASLQNYLQSCHHCSFTAKIPYLQNPNSLPLVTNFSFPEKIRISSSRTRGRDGACPICCGSKTNAQVENVSVQSEAQLPPFDINLAVILAGFAFEAYSTPPENIGKYEVDAANCKTVFLSESFLREIYQGQLYIKLKKGLDLPAMDPWGTSDPYVVLQLDSQVVKSNVKWGTKEPTWNEEFTLNIKLPATKYLQVATWDANLVTPHKRMGNGSINLECLCDGNLHDVLVELEGMGGGGKIQLEVRYKSFDQIDEEKKWWKIPIITEFLHRNGFESALKMIGSDTVQARQFVQFAFGQVKSLNDAYLQNVRLSKLGSTDTEDNEKLSNFAMESDMPPLEEDNPECSAFAGSRNEDHNPLECKTDNGDSSQSDKHFWKNFSDLINQNVVQKLGLPPPEKLRWDGLDLLKRTSLQSRRIAEAGYVESGLAISEVEDIVDNDETTGTLPLSNIQYSFPDIKKVTRDLLRQTDSILGALMVVNAAVSQLNKEGRFFGKSERKEDASSKMDGGKFESLPDELGLDEREAKEMRALFSTAESAMEAWTMLATSLGHPSFIKSEFEKLCFLDNPSTDTQVAIWRDSARKRLVVAFRGTEQDRWKDLRTDLLLVPAGLNPERIGGDFKQEVQVHSGFLSACDSVRTRILALIKLAVAYIEDGAVPPHKWHIYVTGHSLGGALATLLALELSSSQLANLFTWYQNIPVDLAAFLLPVLNRQQLQQRLHL